MLRKFFLGACIGGLLMGQVFESPQERQAQTDKLIVNLNMANLSDEDVVTRALRTLEIYPTDLFRI